MNTDILFQQVNCKERVPSISGWYNTDKGKLFYHKFIKDWKNAWSCRDDLVSEEYPDVWYSPIQVDDLLPDDNSIETGGKDWKKALGMNPYRLNADLDFRAGATAVVMNIREFLKLTYTKYSVPKVK